MTESILESNELEALINEPPRLYNQLAVITRNTSETLIYVMDGVLYKEWERNGHGYLRDSSKHVEAMSLDDLNAYQIPRAEVEAEIARQREAQDFSSRT